jgi:hypothetical protein
MLNYVKMKMKCALLHHFMKGAFYQTSLLHSFMHLSMEDHNNQTGLPFIGLG